MKRIFLIICGFALICQALAPAYAALMEVEKEPLECLARMFRRELEERCKHDPANSRAMLENQLPNNFEAEIEGVTAQLDESQIFAIAQHFTKALTLLQYERDFLKSYELTKRKRQEFVYCGIPLALAGYCSGHPLFYAGTVYSGARALTFSTQINDFIHAVAARFERPYNVEPINQVLQDPRPELKDFVMLLDLASAFLGVGHSSDFAKAFWQNDPMHLEIKSLQGQGVLEGWMDACTEPWTWCFSYGRGKEVEKEKMD
jgi:hypothetical protein